MTKVVIRETIIALLVCLAVLLILSIALYNYIPANKVVPESVQYSPSKEIQTQLNAAVEDNSKEILMTYEVTATDLDNFEKTNEYNPGKANPFAPISDEPDEPTNPGTTNPGTITPEPITPTQPGNPSNNNNNNHSGSLFENGNSK